ncbi:MAG: hypothetical protein QG596_68 [Actinomycetota bacterium]|jgi:uncharacterized protein (DUF305 family)|nr:hypothetical protein [Actinomycetota bacterium]
MFRSRWFAALAFVVGVAFLAGCGSDEDSNTSSAKETDVAFSAGMVPHHESAVEMARIALKESDRPEIRQLANSIITSQQAEIIELSAAYERIAGEEFDPDESPGGGMDHGVMGMSSDEMGMDMDPDDLRGAEPFEREFIDMMVPHHQGAIRMAELQLSEGSDGELKSLSRRIIAAQSAEISQMNRWRKQWYGEISTSGDMPMMHDSGQMGKGN